MPSAIGYYIYAGFIPLLKTFLTILAGFVLTRTGVWTPQGAKGASMLNVNLALPCLVFSSVVPAFNSENIAFIGPIILMTFVYMFAGVFLTLILRELVFVPRTFRWGIISCGAVSNWNSLPTAVLMTIFTHEPFNGTADIQLGIAFVAIFVVIAQSAYFATGFWKTVAWDFVDADKVPLDEGGYEIPESFGERWRRRTKALKLLLKRMRGGKEKASGPDQELAMGEIQDPADAQTPVEWKEAEPASERLDVDYSLRPEDEMAASTSIARSLAASPIAQARTQASPASRRCIVPSFVRTRWRSRFAAAVKPFASKWMRFWSKPVALPLRAVWFLLKNSTSPVTLSILIALPISLLQPLKALFVELEPENRYYGFALGPDGNPCLQFVLNTTNFIGGIFVPQGLLLLGNSFARMEIRKPITKLPILAMFGMTAIKCVILPAMGVALTQYLTYHSSLIPPDAYALRFVIMYLSGTPGAIYQLVITQSFSPDGKADTLAAFLLVQYGFMFIGSSALAAIILSML